MNQSINRSMRKGLMNKWIDFLINEPINRAFIHSLIKQSTEKLGHEIVIPLFPVQLRILVSGMTSERDPDLRWLHRGWYWCKSPWTTGQTIETLQSPINKSVKKQFKKWKKSCILRLNWPLSELWACLFVRVVVKEIGPIRVGLHESVQKEFLETQPEKIRRDLSKKQRKVSLPVRENLEEKKEKENFFHTKFRVSWS